MNSTTHDIDAVPSFFVKCVGYTQGFEKFFTIGKEYEVKNGHITNDNGFRYTDEGMTPDSNPAHWHLARWYAFDIIGDDSYVDLGISFSDIIG